MKFTPEQLTKAKAAKSAAELLALAEESGVEMTGEEAEKYYSELHNNAELADDELANVSGGCGDPKEYQVQGGWAPICDGNFSEWGGNRLYYKPVGNCCGNCKHFFPDNKNDYSKSGVCRREFND